MLTGGQTRDTLVSPRTYLIFLLVALLACPPWAYGDQISWNGSSDSEYSNIANWTDVTLGAPSAAAPGSGDNAFIHSGGGVPATVNLDLEGGLDSVTVNSMSIRGGRVASTATLNVSGANTNITFGIPLNFDGTPYNTYGNVLSIGNRGTLQVGIDPNTFTPAGGTATIELSGGGGSLFPNQANSVGAYVAQGGQIDVSGGGQLVLDNQVGGTRVLTNNGNIGIFGAGDNTAMILNGGVPGAPVPSTFVLAGNGSLTLAGTGAITGGTGAETLVNGPNQTINGSGTISGLAAVTNNGTLSPGIEIQEINFENQSVATGSEISIAGTLDVQSPLTNWNGVNGKLTGGNYSVSSGGVLELDSIGAGNSIRTLNLAGVTIGGSGLAGGDGLITGDGKTMANALGGLSTIHDSSVNLNDVANLTIAPSSGRFPTLTLSSDSVGVPSGLNLNGSNATVQGNLKTSASTYGLPTESATSGISLTNGSTLTVNNNLIASANNTGANSNIVVDASTLTVDNNLRQGGGFGSPLSTGVNTLTLQDGATGTVTGNFSNNSGGHGSIFNNVAGGTSIVNVDGPDTTLGVTGTFSQWQGNYKDPTGVSQLNITDGGAVTVGNLRNSSSVLDGGPNGLSFTPQSQISITGNNSSLTVSSNFANVSGGVLSGGSYTLGTGSALNYNNTDLTDVNTIGSNTLVTLDNHDNGTTGTITNLATGHTLADSLNTVQGALTLQNGASLALTQALNINGGQVSLIGGNVANSLTANGLTNTGTILIAPGDKADFSGGGTAVFTNLNSGVLTGGGTYNVGGTLLFGQGAGQGQGGSPDTSITTLSGVNVSLTGSGAILSGTGATDALANLAEINNGGSLTLNSVPNGVSQNQARTFNGLTIDSSSGTASLTLNNSSALFTASSGNALSVLSGGVLNANGGSGGPNSIATLQLGGGVTALNDTGGAINVNGGGTLVLAGTNPGTFTNNGNLNIGSGATGLTGVASLQTNGGGSAFLIGGGGYVTLAGQGQINVAAGDSLTVAANLTNWTANQTGGGTLLGGAYIVGDGSTLQLQNIGTFNTIQGLTDASVTVTGSGQINGGTPVQSAGQSNGLATGLTFIGSSSPTDALTGLTAITGSSVTLNRVGSSDVPYAITPVNGALTLSADSNGAASLNLHQGSVVTVGGDFNNTTTGGVQSQVAITNGSNLTIAGNFKNVTGSEGSGLLSGGSYLIGGNSQLNYAGSDINTIDTGTTLTLGGGHGGGPTGQLLNGGNDALSTYLNTVNGTLALQNGATLTLSPNANLANLNSSNTFANAGNVSITNNSLLDVSALGNNFQDVTGDGVLNGNYLIGSNSFLNYSGLPNVNQIGGNLTLDNSLGGQAVTGMITNGGPGNDALSGSLNTVGFDATLTLQNNASLYLTSTSFTSQPGAVNITNNSILDVTGVGGDGSGFLDVSGSGALSGNYLIGANSSLNYAGPSNITEIDGNLTLDNTNGTNGANETANTTGKITNQGSEALSGSLSSIYGSLNLQNGAALTLSSSLTNNPGGTVSLDANGNGGSSLTTSHFTNYNGTVSLNNNSTLTVGNSDVAHSFANISDDNNSDLGGQAKLSLGGGSTATITGNLYNASNTYLGGNADAEVDLSTASALQVNGNVKNVANDFSGGTSLATINVGGGSSLGVSGTFKNDSGDFTGYATLNLTNNSTATVSGLFTNTGGSFVYVDYSGNGGSSLTASGGFTNYNSVVSLNNSGATNNSAMTVSGGFLNLADDSSNSEGNGLAVLALGYSRDVGGDLGVVEPKFVKEGQSLNGAAIATITGGLVNNASTSNYGFAESEVSVNSGSVLNVDNLTNSASVNTPNGGDQAEAEIFVKNGSFLNVTGNLSNSASQPLFQTGSSMGFAQASINVSNSNLTVGGAFTNTNAQVTLCSSSFLNSTGGVLNSATDTLAVSSGEGPVQFGGAASFSLTDSAAKITGGFTNSATAVLGGLSISTLSLDNSYMKVDTFTNTASATSGAALAGVLVTDGSYLHVTGNLNNASFAAPGSDPDFPNGASAEILIDGDSAVKVDGVFTQTGATYTSLGSPTSVTEIDGTLTGNVDIQGGLLTGGGTVVGTLTIGGDAVNGTQGTLNPGDPQDFNVIGAYDQTALGILSLDFDDFNFTEDLPVAGQDYDQIDVTGDVSLNGTLTLNLGNDFNALAGTVFDIVNWTNNTDPESGDFSNFIDPVFDNGTLTFQEDNQTLFPNQIDLVVVAVPPVGSSTPEPSTLSMLFCAMLLGGGITWRSRRRRGNVERRGPA